MIPSHKECVDAVKYQHGINNPDYQYNSISEREACVERELLIGIQAHIHERLQYVLKLAVQEKRKPEIDESNVHKLKLMYDRLRWLGDALEKAISACNNAIKLRQHSAVWAAIPERQLRFSARREDYGLVKMMVENVNYAVNDAIARTYDAMARATETITVKTGEELREELQAIIDADPMQDLPDVIQASGVDFAAIAGDTSSVTIPDPNASESLAKQNT